MENNLYVVYVINPSTREKFSILVHASSWSDTKRQARNLIKHLTHLQFDECKDVNYVARIHYVVYAYPGFDIEGYVERGTQAYFARPLDKESGNPKTFVFDLIFARNAREAKHNYEKYVLDVDHYEGGNYELLKLPEIIDIL